jgi:hypothetical protein
VCPGSGRGKSCYSEVIGLKGGIATALTLDSKTGGCDSPPIYIYCAGAPKRRKILRENLNLKRLSNFSESEGFLVKFIPCRHRQGKIPDYGNFGLEELMGAAVGSRRASVIPCMIAIHRQDVAEEW